MSLLQKNWRRGLLGLKLFHLTVNQVKSSQPRRAKETFDSQKTMTVLIQINLS